MAGEEMNVAKLGDRCPICGALVTRTDGPSTVCSGANPHWLVNPDAAKDNG
jgi:hypothetical protein